MEKKRVCEKTKDISLVEHLHQASIAYPPLTMEKFNYKEKLQGI